MATTKKPPVKKPGTALAIWEQQMADAAKKQAGAEKVFGSFKQISTRSGQLAVDDKPIKGNEINVCILIGAHENQFYIGKFDPGQTVPPACYSFGDLDADDPDETMVPHPNVDEEHKQHPNCKDCWANKMASAEQGKGKACKNVRRLGVLVEGDLENEDTIAEAEIRMLKVPVTSVRNYAKYVKNTCAEELNRPTWGVVTKISLAPHAKFQFEMSFEFVELIQFSQETYDALQKRIAELKPAIVAPYPKMEEQEQKPARGGSNKKIAGGRPDPAPKKPLPKTAPITVASKPGVRTPVPAKRAGKY